MSMCAQTTATVQYNRPLTQFKRTNGLFSFKKQNKKKIVMKNINNTLNSDKCNSCPLYIDNEDSLDQMLTCMNKNSMHFYSYSRLHVLSFELENIVKKNNDNINEWIIEDLKNVDSLYYAFLLKSAYYSVILKVLFALQMKKSIIICPNPLLPKNSIIKLCKFLSEKSITLGAPSQCICWIDDPNPNLLNVLETSEKKNIIVHCL